MSSHEVLRAIAAIAGFLALAACGTVTGIPSHGGGKRFAIEQELITASARAALRGIDLTPLAGQSVRIVFATIGDEGSGNLSGGRLSLDRIVRGDYTAGGTIRTTESGGVTKERIPSPSIGGVVSVLGDGPPGYRSEAFINPRDVDFLSTLVATHLIMSGARVRPNPNDPSDVLVIVLVDVFGTIRDRTDYFVFNQERLRARTGIEIAAVRRSDGMVIVPARRSAAEASWHEDYVLWTGPTNSSRSVQMLDDLLMPALPKSSGPAGDLQQSAPPPVEAPRAATGPERPHPVTKPDTKPRTNPPFR